MSVSPSHTIAYILVSALYVWNVTIASVSGLPSMVTFVATGNVSFCFAGALPFSSLSGIFRLVGSTPARSTFTSTGGPSGFMVTSITWSNSPYSMPRIRLPPPVVASW